MGVTWGSRGRPGLPNLLLVCTRNEPCMRELTRTPTRGFDGKREENRQGFKIEDWKDARFIRLKAQLKPSCFLFMSKLTVALGFRGPANRPWAHLLVERESPRYVA